MTTIQIVGLFAAFVAAFGYVWTQVLRDRRLDEGA
jgi:hypothetical protein